MKPNKNFNIMPRWFAFSGACLLTIVVLADWVTRPLVAAEAKESATPTTSNQSADQEESRARRAALDHFRAKPSVDSLRQLLTLNKDSTKFDSIGPNPGQGISREFVALSTRDQKYWAVWRRKKIGQVPAPYYTVVFFFDEQGTLRKKLGGQLSKDGVNGDEVRLTRLGTKVRWFAWTSRFEKNDSFTVQSDVYLIEPKFSFPLAFRLRHFSKIAWTDTEPEKGEHFFWPHGLPDNGEIPNDAPGEGRDSKEHLPRITWDETQGKFRGPAELTYAGQPSFKIDLKKLTRFVPTDTPQEK